MNIEIFVVVFLYNGPSDKRHHYQDLQPRMYILVPKLDNQCAFAPEFVRNFYRHLQQRRDQVYFEHELAEKTNILLNIIINYNVTDSYNNLLVSSWHCQ